MITHRLLESHGKVWTQEKRKHMSNQEPVQKARGISSYRNMKHGSASSQIKIKPHMKIIVEKSCNSTVPALSIDRRGLLTFIDDLTRPHHIRMPLA